MGSLRLLLDAADASNIIFHLKRAWLGTTPNLKHYKPNLDVDTIWSAHASTSAIPTCHHAITMWVLLLWTSNSISPFLEHAVKLPQSGSLSTAVSAKECDVSFTTSSDKRVDALLMLRSKGMITKAEFEQKRRRIINDI